MKFSEPLLQLLAGLGCWAFAVISFSYIYNQKYKDTDLLSQSHTFGFYIFVGMLIIGGLILVCNGFDGVFLSNN